MVKTGSRIMSLQNPEAKMSKSDPNQNGSVFILDTPDVIRRKISSAVTDSGCEIKAAEDKPGMTNLLTLFSAATGKSLSDLESEYQGCGYAQFKAEVADAVIAVVDPIREKYNALIKDKGYLKQVLKKGSEVAQKRAYKTLAKVYKKAGFFERIR